MTSLETNNVNLRGTPGILAYGMPHKYHYVFAGDPPHSLPPMLRNEFIYSAAISACEKSNRWQRAVGLFEERSEDQSQDFFGGMVSPQRLIGPS